MIVKVFSIQDVKAKAFVHTFFMPEVGMAERALKTMVSDHQNQIAQFPEDFVLYQVGEFDQLSGQLVSLATPSYVMKALDAMPKKEG